MKHCLAQTKPVKGDITANTSRHLALIEAAIANGADTIFFPELSLTGYEPALAKELATTAGDNRFAVFQKTSDANNIAIGIGAPVRKEDGITISLLLFQPHKPVETYAKHYLHPDEEAFFISGSTTTGTIGENTGTALAICYELSVPAHAEAAYLAGAHTYIASVAKTAEGMNKAAERMAQIARQYGMATLLVNCVGLCDGVVCDGRSSAWNKKGELLGQLDCHSEGLLLVDIATQEVLLKTVR
ncbi:carbon-nitrogen hydrolase family protein [Flavisolibacter nicotianae]|uniref:carbon-nitrogen hydrolase family protein n=1 Tax=Flavisolibacter nicotianae TaxID=2364882 RepID=UPI000EAD278F|nr:carbon-nitrogen hydrolase family protein [Flavisolibacter nicotianae]